MQDGITTEVIPAEAIPEDQHYIKISFRDNRGVELSLQMINCSVPQLEIAGHFLIRQAESMYRQQAELNAARQPIIAVPGMGALPNLRGS